MSSKKQQDILKRADISTRLATTLELEGRYPQIAENLSKELGFLPEKQPFQKSTWWGTKLGAVLYRGALLREGKQIPAVLKIEGVEMKSDELTETTMIQKAEKALVGSGIRPPKVLREIPWTKAYGGYAATLMEDVQGDYVLPLPGTARQMADLLEIREKYRKALHANHVTPWVDFDIPEGKNYLSRFIRTKFEKWNETSERLFSSHPFRIEEDHQLISQVVYFLVKAYEGVAPEFQQGHFSHRDVVKVGNESVMFSNLYWSWRAPFYDMVFPYHWYMYDVANVPEMTIENIEQQRIDWKKQFAARINTLPGSQQRLFTLARIERLAAGLNLDALSISNDPQNIIAQHMVEQTRDELRSSLDMFK